jgi:hypothetical protein
MCARQLNFHSEDASETRQSKSSTVHGFQFMNGKSRRVLFDNCAIVTLRAFRRACDDLVNNDGIERFVNHQGACEGQHRIAVSNDQRLGLGEGEHR